MPVEEHTLTLAGSPVFYRGAPAAPSTPVYLHTAPTSSADWTRLLERTGGLAPDLIGFGQSAKGGHLDYSPAGMAQFLEDLLTELGVGQLALAGHGWGGAAAVMLAARQPERVRRLLLIDPAPPLAQPPHWHRLARLWRAPLIGELVMGSLGRRSLARTLRHASVRSESWPQERVRAEWDQFDQGTQRATLRLHRWADARGVSLLAGALSSLEVPTLILWGECDPWFPPALADAWTQAMPAAILEVIEHAGHWPWLDCPELVDRIAEFMVDS